ncbi:MAG: sulfotransferase [Roseobacter sp.]|jgi:hypothetical protein|nr:sulfotransferase [Roseobacter sp.]
MTALEPGTEADSDQVFAETRLWPDLSGPMPVVVVGLPRSGTSFLSHALSQLPDYYVFDDLYVLTHAAARKAGDAPLTAGQLDDLLFFLGWQIRARHRFGSYAMPAVEEARAEDLNDALRASFRAAPGTVLDLQAEWLLRLAFAQNARRWGFKMPKAFLQASRLFQAYDGMQLVYMMRQPEDVLASYKNMPDDPTGDGDPRRYHPVVYALYWRLAARSFEKVSRQFPGRVHLVRFHEFIADPLTHTNRLAGILETEPAPQIAKPPKPNSSYRGKGDTSARRDLTGLEARIIRLFCARDIAALGFEARDTPPLKLSDIVDFLRTTVIWAGFHIRETYKRLRAR